MVVIVFKTNSLFYEYEKSEFDLEFFSARNSSITVYCSYFVKKKKPTL